jgi:hypothetical protein
MVGVPVARPVWLSGRRAELSTVLPQCVFALEAFFEEPSSRHDKGLPPPPKRKQQHGQVGMVQILGRLWEMGGVGWLWAGFGQARGRGGHVFCSTVLRRMKHIQYV